MNKTTLIENIAGATSLAKAHVEKVLDQFVDQVTQSLHQGDEISLKGFGSFSVVATKERQGRNPSTGQTLTIPASRKPKFKPSKVLKEAIE